MTSLDTKQLIERLRERAEYNLATCDCDKCISSPCVRCLDAAVETEAADALSALQDEEIARLKAALEEIVDADVAGGPNPYDIARTALGVDRG